jgi:hypothetical protein
VDRYLNTLIYINGIDLPYLIICQRRKTRRNNLQYRKLPHIPQFAHLQLAQHRAHGLRGGHVSGIYMAQSAAVSQGYMQSGTQCSGNLIIHPLQNFKFTNKQKKSQKFEIDSLCNNRVEKFNLGL